MTIDMFGGVLPGLAATRRVIAAEQLLGGGVMGDLQGMPKSQLAVLPGTAHFGPPGHGLLDRADWLLDLIPPFLDEPAPERLTEPH